MVFSGPKRVFFRGDFRLNIHGMYKSLKMLWRFFGELGHGADPRARKKLRRLLDVSLQRIAVKVKVTAPDGIENGAPVLILVLVLDLGHGRRGCPRP